MLKEMRDYMSKMLQVPADMHWNNQSFVDKSIYLNRANIDPARDLHIFHTSI